MKRNLRLLLALGIVMLTALSFFVPAHATSTSSPHSHRLAHETLRMRHLFVDKRTGKVTELTETTTSSTTDILPYHWRRSSGYQTIIRVLYRSTNTRWLGITRLAVYEWNKSSRIYMLMSSTCPVSYDARNCIQIRLRNEGRNGILGTSISSGYAGHVWGSGNVVYFNTAYPEWSTNRNLACHELGHQLGLQHPLDGSQGPCIDVPKLIDYLQLRYQYAHTDAVGPPGV